MSSDFTINGNNGLYPVNPSETVEGIMPGTDTSGSLVEAYESPVQVTTEEGNVDITSFLNETSAAQDFLNSSAAAEFFGEDIMELMNQMPDLSNEQKTDLFQQVCDKVQSNFQYTSDEGGEDYATFQESLGQLLTDGTIKGDCEDPDIFTANLLYSMGFTGEEVNIHCDVGDAEAGIAGHSVLGLTLGGETGNVTTNVYDFKDGDEGFFGAINDLENFNESFFYNNEKVNSEESFVLGSENGPTTAGWFSDVVSSVCDFVSDAVDSVKGVFNGNPENEDPTDTGDLATQSVMDTTSSLFNFDDLKETKPSKHKNVDEALEECWFVLTGYEHDENNLQGTSSAFSHFQFNDDYSYTLTDENIASFDDWLNNHVSNLDRFYVGEKSPEEMMGSMKQLYYNAGNTPSDPDVQSFE